MGVEGSSAIFQKGKPTLPTTFTMESILAYDSKSETFTPPISSIAEEWDISYDPSVHGSSGYIQSSYAPWIWPSTSKYQLMQHRASCIASSISNVKAD